MNKTINILSIIISLFLLCMILAPGVSVASSDWSTFDTVMQSLLISTALVDRHQTASFVNDPRYEEVGWAKPFIGRHPTHRKVNQYFLLGVSGHTALAMLAPKSWEVAGVNVPVRTIWQSFWIGVEVNTTYSNYKIGLNYSF